MALQSRNRKMMCFFRIHRLQYDLRGPKRAQNFDDDGCVTLIKSLVQRHSFLKAGPPIRQWDLLRNPPVEWMSWLGSYQEHLVQSDRSILCKHNYLGLLKSACNLGDPTWQNTNRFHVSHDFCSKKCPAGRKWRVQGTPFGLQSKERWQLYLNHE